MPKSACSVQPFRCCALPCAAYATTEEEDPKDQVSICQRGYVSPRFDGPRSNGKRRPAYRAGSGPICRGDFSVAGSDRAGQDRQDPTMTSARKYGLWIGGRWVQPIKSEVLERCSPSTSLPVASFSLAGPTDIDDAAAAAHSAFLKGAWSELPGSARAKILNRWADLIAADLPRLARIEADEAGKVISSATSEIEWSVELIRYAASLAWNLPGRLVDSEGTGRMGLVSYEPYAVVALILPWNYPMVTLFQKLPYALAAGCSVVIKPSELTAGTTLECAVLAKQAGIPDGVINVVPAVGETAGPAICDSPFIDMISFTGSTRVGRLIASRAMSKLKKVALELGGKGANVVFADADLEAALNGALAGFTINQGEECCAAGRLFVEAPVFEEFVRKLTEKARRMRLGTPDDPDASVGALIHKQHFDKVLGYIAGAEAEGARIVSGGNRPKDEALAKGYFVEPTILTGVTPEMTVFREEIFGPVVCVMPFETDDKAIELVNDTAYGLANGVWTSNLTRGLSFARKVKSGTVYVNAYLETLPQLPFGGMKESGIGRENGSEGLLEFMETKAVYVKLA
ncbi:aldehyde dehydrogenase family protein [Mesorhizobium sp. BAC0120]|uniref:aldehyde dehydrogenase family protein n=1 Tax=Mesorhizobium sp. BAC0120 TaxID=3090670 RepID=UPI00298C7608|nr:aldehyde dehydrogenase family protein [Mesorhizobium sp. BAC0120]MDW6023331.1 aldehyde dehydrogenase family protein [Mesorhizobium sp. BAC0120]